MWTSDSVQFFSLRSVLTDRYSHLHATLTLISFKRTQYSSPPLTPTLPPRHSHADQLQTNTMLLPFTYTNTSSESVATGSEREPRTYGKIMQKNQISIAELKRIGFLLQLTYGRRRAKATITPTQLVTCRWRSENFHLLMQWWNCSHLKEWRRNDYRREVNWTWKSCDSISTAKLYFGS